MQTSEPQSQQVTKSRVITRPIANPNILPSEVMHQIEEDPAFAVVTLDGAQWLDPYTGNAHPCAEGVRAAAIDVLRQEKSYQNASPMDVGLLLEIRWRHDLLRLLHTDKRRHTIFSKDNGRWLNPYSGKLEKSVERDQGKITAKTVRAMARALARCPQASSGHTLPNEVLRQRIESIGYGHKEEPQSSVYVNDMRRAKDVQQQMLGKMPTVPGYHMAIHYEPVSAVSGDFYDVIHNDQDHVIIAIGDVAGHGMQAALTVTTLLKALRLFAKQTTDPLELLVQLNDDLKADLLPGQFVTVALMTLDLSDDSLTTVLAGHHPSLIVDPAGEIILKRTGKSGMGIGLTTGEPFRASLVAQQIFLEPGQTLLQYTDGVEEAKDPAEEEFGRSRVIGILGAGGTMEPQDLVDTLAHATVDHAEHHQVDDLTIFAIRREHEGM